MPAAFCFVTIGWLGLLAEMPLRAGEFRRYEDSRVSMACTYSIVVYGDDVQPLRQIVDAAFDEVDRIDRLMSHYKPDSPLSRLNREAAKGPMKVEPELFDFLAECLRYSRASDGAFDITVGPLMKAWGFFRGEGRMPSEQKLTAARRSVGYQHVILNAQERTVYFDRAGVELDLGGIAKGYAVDRAVAVLKQRGINSALVSAGGSTIYGLGAPPHEAGWEVKLQDPIAPDKTALTVRLKDQALSVSGSYEKFFEMGGRRYSHIMDPRTGRPVEGVLSVAVITDSGTAGDALDNVFYVQGIGWSRKSLRNFPVGKVIFFLPESGGRWRMETLTAP
ncbi:MAG: FAD:protein FMN transferase [Acidobacteriota bacterium]